MTFFRGFNRGREEKSDKNAKKVLTFLYEYAIIVTVQCGVREVFGSGH